MDEVILMICRYLYFYSLKTIVSKPYKYIFCANDISTSQASGQRLDTLHYLSGRKQGSFVELEDCLFISFQFPCVIFCW